MKKKILKRVVILSLIGNIVLTIIKLIFGYYGSSRSLISDGINSFVDIFISLMLVIVLQVAQKKADDNHPYGHEKYEGVLYLFLSLFIIGIAVFLGYQSTSDLIGAIYEPGNVQTPLIYTAIIAFFALLIKVGLYIMNYKTAKKYQSVALMADSKNHLFDIISTSISLISILFSQFGMIYFEFVASIIITLFILYVGLKMLLDAISYLVDEAPNLEVMAQIEAEILRRVGVIRIDDLKVRKHMQQLYVDVEISVKQDLSLQAAHKIAEDVHDHIEDTFDVIHCMVHVNPYDEKNKAAL